MKKKMVAEDPVDNLLFILPKHFTQNIRLIVIYTCEKAVLPSNTLCQPLYFTSLL